MKVQQFDIHTVNVDLYEDFEKFFGNFIRSGRFILDETVQQFEQAFADSVGCTYALGVSSGTDALTVALMTLGIQSGDEVLCPSFTFFATASSVARLGATPVWVDVNLSDFTIDLQDAERKVGAQTKAIIPVHLFGQSCSADAVLRFAKKHNLFIIEDVAQAQGATSDNKTAGSWGHMGCFSFFPTKNLGGFGDAGLITMNDKVLYEKARCIRVHGSPVRYEHTYLGGNFRIDTLQAGLLALKLPHVEDAIRIRRLNAQMYIRLLHDVPGIVLPQEILGRRHTWNQFTIRVLNQQRDALKAFLEKHEIGSAIYYPKTLDLQPCLKDISTDKGYPTECAHQLASEVLSLPIFPGLTAEQIEHVCKTIQHFFEK